MLGISCIYILDIKGRVLITRSYRQDLPNNIYETFNKKVLEFDEVTSKPMFIANDNIFFHMRVSNLIFVVVSKTNCNATMVF